MYYLNRGNENRINRARNKHTRSLSKISTTRTMMHFPSVFAEEVRLLYPLSVPAHHASLHSGRYQGWQSRRRRGEERPYPSFPVCRNAIGNYILKEQRYIATPRMAQMEKWPSTKCQQWYGKTKIVIHSWWECTFVSLLGETSVLLIVEHIATLYNHSLPGKYSTEFIPMFTKRHRQGCSQQY